MVTPQPCILLVDDDTSLLQALPETLALRMPAVQVQVCVSAVEALERIRQYDYDTIVSDIKMPGIDGLALLTRIKELRPETPTLLITGHGEYDLTVQALRGGAYDFIQKPIDRDYFVAALQRATQAYSLRRQVREQQQALERHAQSLEALVQERTRELVEANAAKDVFLGLASHELKTPLTALKGMIQLLRRRDKHTEESLQTGLANMERSIQRMEILVNDLLNTSLLDTAMFALHTEACDLVALCRQILDEYVAGTNLAVTLIAPPEPLVAEVDVAHISQVLLNLLSNAGKYSTRGAPITIRLERAGDKCIIAVQDQGIGISAADLPHIFERFYQVPGSERQTGSSVGLGLGLYVTRKIVERHGGDVEIQSSPGSGSTFSVILPLAVDRYASTQAHEDATPAPPMILQARDYELEQRLRDSEHKLAQIDEFLGIASHELRTPLTTIKGNLQLARMHLAKYRREAAGEAEALPGTLAEIQTMLERAERQVNVQNRMVSDLLNLSRIQADQLDLRLSPCDLVALVKDTVEDQRSAAPTRTIALELAAAESLLVLADAERIEQVISNYLTNALKYAPEERPIVVRLERAGPLARVAVCDEGPGLTPAEQEQVWEPYVRVPGITRQRGFSLGLGLGLYICQAIVEQHQGQVGVTSAKGRGSTFWFTLPLAEQEHGTPS